MALYKRLTGTSLAGLALAAALLVAPTARAQNWLASAYPDRPMLGPAKALGAVVWSHGRSVDSEDSKAPTPPYMALLRDNGWDTYRFNRMRDTDTLQRSSADLGKIGKKLKAQGYSQVALAAQSFGGFLSLMAADDTTAVDAVVAMAPAAYGSFGDFYGSWRENATKLYPLLERIKSARVMLFYFHGDDFDPGGRGVRSREILSARHLEYAVIDQPPRLTSHWAATTPQFVQAYGNCILGFLDAERGPPAADCSRDALWASDPTISPHQMVAAPVASIQGSARE
jgi:pimeloyl-ACP methyl ester carboxylesterase